MNRTGSTYLYQFTWGYLELISCLFVHNNTKRNGCLAVFYIKVKPLVSLSLWTWKCGMTHCCYSDCHGNDPFSFGSKEHKCKKIIIICKHKITLGLLQLEGMLFLPVIFRLFILHWTKSWSAKIWDGKFSTRATLQIMCIYNTFCTQSSKF